MKVSELAGHEYGQRKNLILSNPVEVWLWAEVYGEKGEFIQPTPGSWD